jgi:hypothetical protein
VAVCIGTQQGDLSISGVGIWVKVVRFGMVEGPEYTVRLVSEWQRG